MNLKNSVEEALKKAGTSAGAKLGWERRKHGGGTPAKPESKRKAKVEDDAPHLGVKPSKHTPQQREDVVNWMSKKRLSELRRRQDIVSAQHSEAAKHGQDTTDLVHAADVLTAAVDRKVFGAEDRKRAKAGKPAWNASDNEEPKVKPMSSDQAHKEYNSMTSDDISKEIVKWSNGDAHHILKAIYSALEDSNAHTLNQKIDQLIANTPAKKPLNMNSKIASMAEGIAKTAYNEDYYKASKPEERSAETLGLLASQHTFALGDEVNHPDFKQKSLIEPLVQALKDSNYPESKMNAFMKIYDWSQL